MQRAIVLVNSRLQKIKTNKFNMKLTKLICMHTNTAQ